MVHLHLSEFLASYFGLAKMCSVFLVWPGLGQPHRPWFLTIFFFVPASGKSTRHLRNDVERKEEHKRRDEQERTTLGRKPRICFR